MSAAESRLKRAAAFETGVWRSLFYWVRKRPILPDPEASTFGYAKAGAPAVWVFVAISAVEIPILHLLVPAGGWRIAALILGAWGVIWMIGFAASLYVHPHLVGPAGLRVRNGLSVDLPIDWSNVVAIRPRKHTLPNARTLQLQDDGDEQIAVVAVASQVNVEAELREPVSVRIRKVGEVQVSVLRWYADEPFELVAAARNQLGSAADPAAR